MKKQIFSLSAAIILFFASAPAENWITSVENHSQQTTIWIGYFYGGQGGFIRPFSPLNGINLDDNTEISDDPLELPQPPRTKYFYDITIPKFYSQYTYLIYLKNSQGTKTYQLSLDKSEKDNVNLKLVLSEKADEDLHDSAALQFMLEE